MPPSLDALGTCLISRFERRGQISDLEQAVSCFKINMSLVPEGHPDKAKYWSHLGRALTSQFDYLDDISDLSTAIESYSQALALSSDAGVHRAEQFTHLGQLYMSRFQRLGDQADLNRSVENRELALTLVPEDHPGRAGCLSALGDALVICFESTGEVLHLDQAVGYYNEAIMSTPAPHVNRPAYQKNLADTLSLRANHLKVNPNQASQIVDFQQLGGSSDVEASIQQYQQAAEAVESPFVRFGAALSWARLSFPSQMPSALQGYQQVMNIIPQRVWLGSPGETWKRDLQEVSPVMAEAAAAAIQAQSYDLALEWMEQARLATWKATMQLRASIDSLRSIDTMLAEHIQMVAHELNNPTNEKTELSLQRTRRLAEQFESLTLQARSLPGLERFMRIAKAAELMRAAHSGAVVVINAYTTRCDALVILPHSESTVHVPLPSFSYDKADQALSQLAALTHREVSSEVGQAQGEGTFESILAMLWGDVVKPVLDTVEYTKPTSASPLALLPLHAAGLYGEPNSKIYDYVVSSYTPDLTSLLPSTRSLGSFKGIVGVSQALDKSNMTISKGTNELDEIAKRATTSDVLSAMQSYSWVHLACSATYNQTDPGASSFHLSDGELNLATIIQAVPAEPGFAFLSVAQTKTGSQALSDGALKLAAGMMLAGYPSVIVKMQAGQDAYAPQVVGQIYAQLQEGVTSGKDAARSLHNTMSKLRDEVGEKAFGVWVPYIHFVDPLVSYISCEYVSKKKLPGGV
ncbi:hypothetical protein BDV93DRAFT_507630 [Ceratobasidium sp. AG-I]|nr:hypothetical protein BDV93DRAFT_507630 [Ceratobasidium sp. AG-I]